MGNPMVLEAIQNKLAGMVGDKSGYVQRYARGNHLSGNDWLAGPYPQSASVLRYAIDLFVSCDYS